MSRRRATAPPDSLRGHYAGFVSRYIAFLLDVLLIALVWFLVVSVARVTLNFFGLDQWFSQMNGPRLISRVSIVRWLMTVAGSFLVFGVYSVVAWLLVGKTVGKAVMGLRVLGADGQRIGIRQALIRAFSYYVSGLALFVGFLWVLVDDRRQTWHDKLANTAVVYEWDARQEERVLAAVSEWRAERRQRRAAREREKLAASAERPAGNEP